MTAEVAVMNRSAVALAADSAMTVTVGEAKKTYPTNKLFALTKHRPVGFMVYNNADFMDIPWETIVKMYRQEIGSSGKATVKEYAEDFLGYVGNTAICSAEQRQRNILRIAVDLFGRIAQDVHNLLSNPPAGSNTDVPTVIRDVVNSHSVALTNAGTAPSMQNVDASNLVGEQQGHVNELVDRYFANHVTDVSLRQLFLETLEAALNSLRLSSGFAGLVFAGFGEDEIFPSLVEIMTDGAIGDVVKADTRTTYDLARTGTQTAIVPFAQSEMVERFMEGIDPNFLRYVEIYFRNLLTSAYSEILQPTASPQPLTDDQESALHSLVETKVHQFRQDTNDLRRDGFVNPVLGIVRHLPKEELASMAEALVSLTSLKRRVSLEEESVGGPVDVAVVSKGDGFIWIKRKHYFDPLLNRDYFNRQPYSQYLH